MLAVRRADAHKWLAAANLIAAVVVAVPALLLLPTLASPPGASDIDGVGYAWAAALLCLPTAALLGLAASAHWWRWPLRWVFQGLAVALPAVFAALFLLGK